MKGIQAWWNVVQFHFQMGDDEYTLYFWTNVLVNWRLSSNLFNARSSFSDEYCGPWASFVNLQIIWKSYKINFHWFNYIHSFFLLFIIHMMMWVCFVLFTLLFDIICSPELKSQVNFSDQNVSVVHPCCHVCCHCGLKRFTFLSSSPE